MSTYYRIKYPTEVLKPYINCYFEIYTGKAGERLHYALPAELEQTLFFMLEDVTVISSQASGRSLLSKDTSCYIMGQLSHSSLELKQDGIMAVLSVSFHPTGFFRLFGVPMDQLADSIVPAAAVLHRNLEYLGQAVREMANMEERIEHIEKYMLAQLERKRVSYSHIDDTALYMIENPNKAIPELASMSCLCERQFRRKFLERTGISPLTFSRVCRVHNAWNSKQLNPIKSWRSLAFDTGFTDQSHMIREMKWIMGIEKLSSFEDVHFVSVDGTNFKVGEAILNSKF